MSDIIQFPSASNQSKLSACPTTKLPKATDWIYQDFCNQMLHDNKSMQHIISNIDDKTIFSEGLRTVVSKSNLEWDTDYAFCPTTLDDQTSLPDLDNSDDYPIGTSSEFSELFDVAPALIESTTSSLCTTVSEYDVAFRENSDPIFIQPLKKRTSTSSFRSLKSLINVFSSNKKSKPDTLQSKKFFQFFKRRS